MPDWSRGSRHTDLLAAVAVIVRKARHDGCELRGAAELLHMILALWRRPYILSAAKGSSEGLFGQIDFGSPSPGSICWLP